MDTVQATAMASKRSMTLSYNTFSIRSDDVGSIEAMYDLYIVGLSPHS